MLFSISGVSLLISLSLLSVQTAYPTTDLDDKLLPLPSSNGNNNQQMQSENINVLFSNGYRSSINSYHVNGEIENFGNTILENVEAIGRFYSEDNQLIGVTQCCSTDPDQLAPGQSARFESFAQENEVNGIPKYYTVSFEWKDKGKSTESDGDVKCGTIVNSDITLTSNLYCNSDGLIIRDQNGLNIDLNGYSISGPGEKRLKAGIIIGESSNVNIKGNGFIKGFQAGILNSESQSSSIKNVTLTNNEIGIFTTGTSGSEMKGNNIGLNSIGISAQASDSLIITENILDSNDLAGIALENSGESMISSNTITGSVNGLFLDGESTNNEINNNQAFENRGVDINNGNGLPVNINNNTFNGNSCDTSVPDELCENDDRSS